MSATKVKSTKRLYIGNLDEAMNEYSIVQLFKPFGKITFIEVMFHWTGIKKGLPRGYCFLEYETQEQALKAINTLNGKCIRGKSLVVTFAQMTVEQDDGKKRKKPSHISLIKGHKMKSASTNEKIKAIEKKLESLKSTSNVNTSSSSSSSSDKRYKPY